MNFSTHPLDTDTSAETRAVISAHITDLQWVVLDFIRTRGTVIDSDIVEYGAIKGYAESTLRKRRTELSQMGLLELVGTRKNIRGRKEHVWQVTPSQIELF